MSFEPKLDKRKRERENHIYRNMRIESGMHINDVDAEEERSISTERNGIGYESEQRATLIRICTTAADRSKQDARCVFVVLPPLYVAKPSPTDVSETSAVCRIHLAALLTITP